MIYYCQKEPIHFGDPSWQLENCVFLMLNEMENRTHTIHRWRIVRCQVRLFVSHSGWFYKILWMEEILHQLGTLRHLWNTVNHGSIVGKNPPSGADFFPSTLWDGSSSRWWKVVVYKVGPQAPEMADAGAAANAEGGFVWESWALMWRFPAMGVSQKWRVYKGKSHCNGWSGGTPISGNPHVAILWRVRKVGTTEENQPVHYRDEHVAIGTQGYEGVAIGRSSLIACSDISSSSWLPTMICHIFPPIKINILILINMWCSGYGMVWYRMVW